MRWLTELSDLSRLLNLELQKRPLPWLTPPGKLATLWSLLRRGARSLSKKLYLLLAEAKQWLRNIWKAKPLM